MCNATDRYDGTKRTDISPMDVMLTLQTYATSWTARIHPFPTKLSAKVFSRGLKKKFTTPSHVNHKTWRHAITWHLMHIRRLRGFAGNFNILILKSIDYLYFWISCWSSSVTILSATLSITPACPHNLSPGLPAGWWKRWSTALPRRPTTRAVPTPTSSPQRSPCCRGTCCSTRRRLRQRVESRRHGRLAAQARHVHDLHRGVCATSCDLWLEPEAYSQASTFVWLISPPLYRRRAMKLKIISKQIENTCSRKKKNVQKEIPHCWMLRLHPSVGLAA